MQEEPAQESLEDRVYQLLCADVGQPWIGVWGKIYKAIAASPRGGGVIGAMVFEQVVRHAYMDVRHGKAVYYDIKAVPMSTTPLAFGQLFVDPISGNLSMIGYSPIGCSPPKEKPVEKEPIARRLKKISELTYLCKCFDGIWYEIRYSGFPKMWHFNEPDENYGHVEFLKPEGMDDLGGYVRGKLDEKKLKEFGLKND